jgi:hypothetical protein
MPDMRSTNIPFTSKNLKIFIAGLLVIGLGYVLLSIPPADGFLSLTMAPVVLVLGYCVIIPVSLLFKDTCPSSSDGGSNGIRD